MTKSKLYTIIMFSFSAAMVEFMSLPQQAIFPRDRVLHIVLSAVVSMTAVYILNLFSFKSTLARGIAFAIILCRTLFIWRVFAVFLRTFYGDSAISLTITTVTVVLLLCRCGADNLKNMHNFFIALNITFFLMIILLSADKINVANIYANSTDFSFSVQKIFVFFDILTIIFLCDNPKERLYAQKRYIIITSLCMIVIALLEGFCISGNMMYSISPLQALMQIFGSKTVKRFDFFVTLYGTICYFAAIMMYTWTGLKLTGYSKEKTNENN